MEAKLEHVDGNRKRGWYRAYGKQVVDVVFAAIGLLLLAPVLIVLAFAIWIKLGSPIFFRHERPGLGGRPFTLYKFRSMTDARDSDGNYLPDEQRLTPFGLALRRTSLDELPELFNVLRGEMSLVGPRPLLIQYLNRYTDEQRRRNDVRPGLTGLAQINGRNALSWERRFELDVWYVDHVSLGLDLNILWKTVGKVFRCEDINHPGHTTMSEFKGS